MDHSLLQGGLLRPFAAVKSISAAFGTDVAPESETRTTTQTFVWMGFSIVAARERRFDTIQSAHCNLFP